MDIEHLLNNEESRMYFRRIINAMDYDARNDLGKSKEIIDSFSMNQIESKKHLIDVMEKAGIFESNKRYGVMGCWFGSIIFPLLLQRGGYKIHGWDMDPHALKIAHFIFENTVRVNLHEQDVWLERPRNFHECDVIINSSCEHMPPMCDWPFWKLVNSKHNPVWVFQSNNMHGERDHINTVDSLEEFENQMHPMFDIMYSDEMDHPFEEGMKRFTIVGQMHI